MGISYGASVVYLPHTAKPYPTLLMFFTQRFPKVATSTWEKRIAAGKVFTEAGIPVTFGTEYAPDTRLFYRREVEEEPPFPFTEEIVYIDDHLLVACKPHFLPVTPTGPYVRETLLVRLQERTGNPHLSPIHRIDRETAGLVLFSTNRKTRGRYQHLFMTQEVRKTYEALVHFHDDCGQTEWWVENRIIPGEPWFRMHISPGEANARTLLRLLEIMGNHARVLLYPETGKKHQLRLHLASLGMPIVNDRCYPQLHDKTPDDFSHPLQLLARQIEFRDPITTKEQSFMSPRSLLPPSAKTKSKATP